MLPRHERGLVRSPLILLAIYGLARFSMAFLPANEFPNKLAHFIAVFTWFAAIVRSGFILFTRSRLARLSGRPWPKILRDVVQALSYFGVGMIALRAIGVEPS